MLGKWITLADAASGASEAAAENAQSGAEGGWGMMLPMIIIFAAMFYLMYRSQKKEQKRRVEMINSVKAGSRILTVGGMLGNIVTVKDESFEIEIAKNVKVEISKNAIASVIEDVKADNAGEKAGK